MSIHNIRSIVNSAAGASLSGIASVRGFNTYNFGTNLLSWDESNNYTFTRVAKDFGQVVSNSGVDGTSSSMFVCGDSSVCAYDFGLIFSCITAIVGASTESGMSVQVDAQDTTDFGVEVVWFGSNAVVYGRDCNIILPIKSADVKNASSYKKVTLENFVDTRTYILTREGNMFVIDGSDGSAFCKLKIPEFVKRMLPAAFISDGVVLPLVDDPNTPWDERSPLGSLIANSISVTSAEETIKRYKENVTLESVVQRSDLLFTPSIRYNSVDEFLGSLCYTDKDVIAMAVNFRNNLFVYETWFTGDRHQDIQTDASPHFDKFYNVTEACAQIERFAASVTNRPLSMAQFNVSVFEKVKDAFFNLELPRIKLVSTFGRIVIPESVLVRSVGSALGESIYCVVPVGVIGSNVICKTDSGALESLVNPSWLYDDALYDITEVVI